MNVFAALSRGSRRLGREAFEAYFTLDTRSLGIARFWLGGLLFYDMWRRVTGIATWYSNEGLLPNHIALKRPAAEYMFSFLFAASRPAEAGVMFVLSGVAFIAFTIGYRTKLFHALSLACLVSLHSRAIFLENGGDVVLNLLCAWTLFLPMGDRFSVDRLRKSLRARRERSIDELNDRQSLPPVTTRVSSLVVLAILLQLSAIYYLNALHKTGWTWHQGLAVHYVLYQERMVTWFGMIMRQYLPTEVSRRLTYTTFNIELLAPLFILNPFFRTWSRRAAILLYAGLHIGFAAALNLGQFSFNMLGFYPLLIGPRDWDWFGRWLGPAPSRARTVYLNERSALAFGWARLLVRLDRFDRLRFAAETDESVTWSVARDETTARTRGTAAVAEVLRALPCGRPFGAVLGWRAVRALGDAIGRRLSAGGETMARARGLSAPGPSSAVTRAPAAQRESPARVWLRRLATAFREVAIVVTAVALGSQLLVENKAISARYKVTQPKWMLQVVAYPRLFQGWAMFSADVPTGERMLYVDATMASGRHVDPYNEAASRVASLPLERIPVHMEQDEFWCDFTNRVPDNDTYWPALREWVLAYPRRIGKPEDRVLSFEARLLEEEKAPPGEHGARNFRTKVVLRGSE